MILSKVMPLLVCSIAVCSADWPTYHGDASLSGVSDATLPEQPQMRWRLNAGGAVYGTPVSDGERIFFAAKKGRVIAADLKGSNCWNRVFTYQSDSGQERTERFDAPLVCSQGVVVAGSVRGMVYAVDAATGNYLWSYDSEGTLIGSPNVIEKQLILLDQSEGSLHALDLLTGKLLWKTDPIERCDGVPGIGNDHIVFGSCLAAFHVFSREGKHLRNIEIGGDAQIAGGVAVLGSHAFGGARDGGLLCVDLNAGEIIWSSDESDEATFSTPAVTEDRVVYASDNGFIYCANRTDGGLIWKYDVGGAPYSPVVAGDKVTVVADGTLFLLKLATGTKLWSKEVSDDITAPAVICDLLVVGADDGTVSGWGRSSSARDSNVYE
ncbi:PQQ-binding-like beta-propeller repeat protein [Pontiellaceae bacterium B1224]|nr:PQQ-binding-like beta-propeller repeat protein [Pontiellaceae bacterium B1224]